MPKKVGLARHHKKYLEVIPFIKGINPAGTFYIQSRDFYDIFKQIFKNGHDIVRSKTTLEDGREEFSLEKVPVTKLGACLTNYHFAVELLLKALICLKNKGPLNEDLEHHDLILLFEETKKLYPHLVLKPDHLLLLRELGTYFQEIRYLQAMICLSNNKGSGWKTKAPLEELSILLDEVYCTLFKTFEEEKR